MGAGSAGQVLPFSKFVLSNLDTDPSVISDFDGFSALAYPVGSAHGSDGKRYNLEGDMRVFRGMYLPLNGVAHVRAHLALFESTCSTRVRATRSTTSTEAFNHPACSGSLFS